MGSRASRPLLVIASILLFAGPLWGGADKEMFASDQPIEVTADRIEQRGKGLYIAEGSVRMTQGEMRASADRVEIDEVAGVARARGHIDLFDGKNRITADRIEIALDTRLGVIYQGRIFIQKENYTLQARRIERVAPEVYRMEEASFTACDCDLDGMEEGHAEVAPPWRFRARKLRLLTDRYVEGRGVRLEIKGVPIFYSPYLIYPVVRERSTGLLVPKFSYNTAEGFKINQPFFWAISRSQDATFNLDWRSAKGIGGGMEYRYVPSAASRGELAANYFHDEDVQRDRLDLRYVHRQQLGPRVVGRFDLRYVNVQDLFRELSETTEERSQRLVESNALISYRGDVQYAYILARFIRDLSVPQDLALHRLPEVGYGITRAHVGALAASDLFFDLDLIGTRFYRVSGIRGERADLFPRLALPTRLAPGVVATPSAGFRGIAYSRRISSETALFREAFPLGVNLSVGAPAGTRLDLDYEYIPVIENDLSEVPQFDDLDRIRRKNLLTGSVTSRSGLFLVRVTDSYRVGSQGPKFSQVRNEISVPAGRMVMIEIDSFYDPYGGKLSTFDADLTMNRSWAALSVGERFTRGGEVPRRGDIFNPLSLGEVEQAPKIEFVTANALFSLPGGVTLANRVLYDIDHSRMAEISYGVEYRSQCWGMVIAYQDFPEKNQISFMVTLRGAGELGTPRLAGMLGHPVR